MVVGYRQSLGWGLRRQTGGMLGWARLGPGWPCAARESSLVLTLVCVPMTAGHLEELSLLASALALSLAQGRGQGAAERECLH